MERSQSSTSGDAEPADEPLDNNRPGDHELPGERTTTVTIARVPRRPRKWGAPRRVAVQSQCSTQRRPSGKGGLFPTKAMPRPSGRSRPLIDADSAVARREQT